MNTIARTIVGAIAVAAMSASTATIATAAPAPTADTAAVHVRSAAKHFTVIQTWQRAKLGACKVAVKNGTAWRVFGRLDTHRVRVGRYSGTLMVMKVGKDAPVANWHTALIAKGRYSKVGSVVLPKAAGYSLGRGIGMANMGDGGPIKISRIGGC